MSVTKSALSSVAFLTTRSRPACSQTKSRPSGANAMAVGLVRPVAIRVSTKPAGRVAAARGEASAGTITAANSARGKTRTANPLGSIGNLLDLEDSTLPDRRRRDVIQVTPTRKWHWWDCPGP